MSLILIRIATSGKIDARVYDSALALILVDWVMFAASQAIPRTTAHPEAQAVLLKPHPFYTYRNWTKAVTEYILSFGVSYVRMFPDSDKRPTKLLPISPNSISEMPDSVNGSGDWKYINANGAQETVAADDMLVFKYKVKAGSPYEGVGPFDKLTSFMYMDNRSAEYTGYVLKNAITGWLAGIDQGSDKSVAGQAITGPDQRKAADRLSQMLQDEKTGLMEVLPFALSLVRLEPTFTDLDFTRFHNLAEERVCGAGRVHPSVLGLGTGVQNTRVGATAYEYRRESWRSGTIPILQIIEDTLVQDFLPRFVDNPQPQSIIWFRGHINELRPSPNEMEQLLVAHAQGIFNANDVREEYGKEPKPGGDVYVTYPPESGTESEARDA